LVKRCFPVQALYEDAAGDPELRLPAPVFLTYALLA
jgi:hypothetical protein